MADWDTIRARLEQGTYTGWLANDIRAALQRIEELERALKSADESIERNKRDRDEWRDTAQSEMAGRRAAEANLERVVEATDRVLTEAGMQAHKHGCANRVMRPARWDEFQPCAGCAAEAALAAAKGE